MARRVPAGSSLEEGTKDLLLPTQTRTWLPLPRRATTEKTKPLTLAYLRNWRISSSLRMVGIVGRKRPKRKGRMARIYRAALGRVTSPQRAEAARRQVAADGRPASPLTSQPQLL